MRACASVLKAPGFEKLRALLKFTAGDVCVYSLVVHTSVVWWISSMALEYWLKRDTRTQTHTHFDVLWCWANFALWFAQYADLVQNKHHLYGLTHTHKKTHKKMTICSNSESSFLPSCYQLIGRKAHQKDASLRKTDRTCSVPRHFKSLLKLKKPSQRVLSHVPQVCLWFVYSNHHYTIRITNDLVLWMRTVSEQQLTNDSGNVQSPCLVRICDILCITSQSTKKKSSNQLLMKKLFIFPCSRTQTATFFCVSEHEFVNRVFW